MKINKKYKGVTFAELIIVIAIMGIMGSVGFVSLQSSRNSVRLTSAQREVAATIRLAQSHALQGKTQNGQTPCGYGFRFTSVNRYEIFYKLPNVGKDCSDTNFSSFNIVDNLKLENNVVLSSPADFSNSEIYFAIPFGNIYAKNGTGFAGAAITLQYPADTGAIKSITINSAGSIVEN